MTNVSLENYAPLKEGFSIFSKKDLDSILVNPSFRAGKQGNEEAARQLINQIWTDEKTQQLKTATQGQDILFISMPGTSRKNKVPIVFAEFLAEKTGCNYVVGDEHVYSLHSSMMKSVKNGQRVFSPRMYEATNFFFQNIKELKPNCSVVIVEDILTTGASAYTFYRFLKKNGLNVQKIFAIKGDTTISPSEAEILKLQKMADKVHLDMNLMDLGKELTKNEVTFLTYNYIGVTYKNASDKQKKLIKEQLECLRAIRVDGDYEKSVRLGEINKLLEQENGGQNGSESKRDNKNATTRGALRESLRRLEENSRRTEASGRSQQTPGNVYTPDVQWVRNDTQPTNTPQTKIAMQKEFPSTRR